MLLLLSSLFVPISSSSPAAVAFGRKTDADGDIVVGDVVVVVVIIVMFSSFDELCGGALNSVVDENFVSGVVVSSVRGVENIT